MIRGSHRFVALVAMVWLLGHGAGCPASEQAQPVDKGPLDAGGAGDGDDGDPVPTTSGVSTSEMPGSSTGTSTAGDETGGGSGTGGDSTTATTATTALPGTCGDGVVQEGESCDLGFAENRDDGVCTQSCQQAYCGDGLVWLGEELCDDGPANNDTTYQGCREDCTPGPRCGDGVLQEQEECDASAPPTEGNVGCDPANCRLMARVAFVTAATFAGDLGGLTGADEICRTAAAAAGLDSASSFLAWLGDGVSGPVDRFVDGAQAPGYPYARRDGQKLANDLDALLATGLEVPLKVTELGTVLPPEQYAWTGLTFYGEPVNPHHCDEWGSDYFKYSGVVGQISPASESDADLFDWRFSWHWTDYTSRLCKMVGMHLYCFED